LFPCRRLRFDINQQKEGEVMETKYRVPIFVAVERLQEASQQAGLTEDDVIGMLASGLDVCEAVTYVEAVLSNRVH
jgi:hypothetical protein